MVPSKKTIRTLLLPLGLVFCSSLIMADAPDGEAETETAERLPSAYAPAADLLAQVDYYIGRVERDLTDASNFGADQRNRIALNASALSSICLVIGIHDEENPLHASAVPLLEASQELASAAKDFDKAVEALAAIQQILDNPAEGVAAEMEREPIADIELLMQQVPIVNNALRRAVNSRRFDREIEAAAGHAATLAAIAQASLYDLNYTYDGETEALWIQICIDLRDASADTLHAVRAGDQEAAIESLERIVHTCDACHDEFQ